MQKKRDGKPSKASFIRLRPTATIDEIIAAGKAEGLDISRQAVHQVRHQQRFETKLNGKKKGAKRKSAVKTKAVHASKKSNGKAQASKFLLQRPKTGELHTLEGELGPQAIQGLVDGLRTMVKLSVKQELRSVMGDLFGPQLGNYLSKG